MHHGWHQRVRRGEGEAAPSALALAPLPQLPILNLKTVECR